MIQSTAPTNRLALISFLSAFMTGVSFCIGVAPIPMTAWVCYPLAILLGFLAMLTGSRALRQIRTSGEKGRAMALIGIWVGAFTSLAVLCFTVLTTIFIIYGVDYINTVWSQLRP